MKTIGVNYLDTEALLEGHDFDTARDEEVEHKTHLQRAVSNMSASGIRHGSRLTSSFNELKVQ